MTAQQVKINVGRRLTVMHLNIEGTSADKSEVLSRKALEHQVDVIAVQETHISDAASYNNRGNVPGFKVAAYLTHASYGIVTYVRDNHNSYSILHLSQDNDVSCIVIELFGIKVTNVYKPPNQMWPEHVLALQSHPAIYVGDFNSHNTFWGYARNNEDGNKLQSWADSANLFLVQDLKDLTTFQSARWRTGTNPDLCFVSKDRLDRPLKTTRKVLKNFPRSQHRPVIITIGTQINTVNSMPKPRWNFQKADWTSYTARVESSIRFIPNDIDCYQRFLGVIKGAAKKSIPRGFRKRYIPCWTSEMESLYKEFEEQDDDEISDRLLELLSAARKAKWENLTEQMDFTHSSRKCWRLLRHLGEASVPVKTRSKMDPDRIASVIVGNSTMISPETSFKRKIEKNLRKLKQSLNTSSEFDRPFTLEELDTAINSINIGKASGLDGLYPEFLKHLGKRARLWVLKFLNKILKFTKLPPLLMKSIVIAILKPGKSADDPTKYRPIALLSTMYKLLERLIYNRIKGTVDSVLPAEQAGFRENRSCVEQLLTLTTHIESGFEKNLKTAFALVDLSSAYDTIWRIGFMWKFYNSIPCKKLGQLVNQMLSNRIFRVFINDRSSRPRRLNNGFPQGSVCAPNYFNLYASDMPWTQSRKFSFADDLGLATQVTTFEMGEEILENDLRTMKAYYKQWCLCLNDGKTEVTMFHLNNGMATRQLNVYVDGKRLEHNMSPTYLGLPLDRTLSYKLAMEQRGKKLKVRNNLIQKIAGSNWGANGNVLRTSVLSLVYSAAEYASPVWYACHHTDQVDVQLNVAMRTITGAVDSTPVPWLHVLSNIEPPQIRRKMSAHKEWKKCLDESRLYDLPIKNDLLNPPPSRLVSRSPIWNDTEIQHPNFSVHDQWISYWNESPSFTNKHLIQEPHRKLEGFSLPRREWKMLNRFRSGHGCSGDQMYKWRFRDSPYCDCGDGIVQTMEHIINVCPIRKFNGNLQTLHSATTEAISWLSDLDIEI